MQVAGVWIDSARYASDTLSHEVTETTRLLVTTPNRDVGPGTQRQNQRKRAGQVKKLNN